MTTILENAQGMLRGELPPPPVGRLLGLVLKSIELGLLHFLQGEAKLTLGDGAVEAKPSTWVHMPTGLRHSIQAKSAGGHAALVDEVIKGRRDVGSCRRGARRHDDKAEAGL